MVKNLSTMQETWVQSLSQEDPLEKEMAIQFSFLAWEVLWTEELQSIVGYSLWVARVGHNLVTKSPPHYLSYKM